MKIEIEYDELKRLIISESENSCLLRRIDELKKEIELLKNNPKHNFTIIEDKTLRPNEYFLVDLSNLPRYSK